MGVGDAVHLIGIMEEVMNIPRHFGKIVLSVISIAALMIFLTPQFVFAGEKPSYPCPS